MNGNVKRDFSHTPEHWLHDAARWRGIDPFMEDIALRIAAYLTEHPEGYRPLRAQEGGVQ